MKSEPEAFASVSRWLMSPEGTQGATAGEFSSSGSNILRVGSRWKAKSKVSINGYAFLEELCVLREAPYLGAWIELKSGN